MDKLKSLNLLFLFLFFCLTLFSQVRNDNSLIDSSINSMSINKSDSIYWVDNFRQFRDAIYQNNKTKAKNYFDFPIDNGTNDLWYVVLENSNRSLSTFKDSSNLFTENDFDKNFNNLFSVQFIHSFLKIKMNELYVNGESISPDFTEDSTTYRMHATYSKIEKTIDLSLNINSSLKISETEFDPYESSFIYQFEILKNGQIKFKKLFIAG